ncbi:MAG: DUF3883 domain-containing protein, partial [Candidatus Hydrogenedentes bacterium]|nr:DUF3883 domain-containing protein [Candidatus Hydrogenedentota bacterium]
NFVSTNTREGRVLQKLFERLAEIEKELDPQRTGKVFNVLGDIFPSNELERMVRNMYARNLTEDAIKKRIVEDVDTERFRSITQSTLEGLAKRELNLSYVIGKSAEARERRLVPEVVEEFFTEAAPVVGVSPTVLRGQEHAYRVGRVPRTLWPLGDQLEGRFGRLGREYKNIVFDKELLRKDATWEWVTPGHPLFECVRAALLEDVRSDLKRGAVFYDLHHAQPYRLDVFTASIRDGLGRLLHRKLFVVQTDADGALTIRQPTIFLDLALAPKGTATPNADGVPSHAEIEQALIEQALNPFLAEVAAERAREVKTISDHIEISLNAIINRVQLQFADITGQKEMGSTETGLDGRLKMMEDRLFELNGRLERRQEELEKERHCMIGDIECIGRAWVLPHPERTAPSMVAMVRDEEIEHIAVEAAIKYEEARGCVVQSVESENKGFDLVSRRFDAVDPTLLVEYRYIEVKGRACIGEIALTANEYKTAERLKKDYWLYVVYNCAATPGIHCIQDPGRLGWKPLVKVEHYRIDAKSILSEIKV